jgi:hypothetical protein
MRLEFVKCLQFWSSNNKDSLRALQILAHLGDVVAVQHQGLVMEVL